MYRGQWPVGKPNLNRERSLIPEPLLASDHLVLPVLELDRSRRFVRMAAQDGVSLQTESVLAGNLVLDARTLARFK